MRKLALFAAALVLTAGTAAQAFFLDFGEKSLYQRLGGQKAIVAVVDDFVGNVARDRRINRFFARTNIPRLKRLLVAQLCAATGGPCEYRGRSMKATHRGLRIRDRHFDALVEDLVRTLNKFEVPKREQRELIGILAPLRGDIVERR